MATESLFKSYIDDECSGTMDECLGVCNTRVGAKYSGFGRIITKQDAKQDRSTISLELRGCHFENERMGKQELTSTSERSSQKAKTMEAPINQSSKLMISKPSLSID